MNSHIDTYSTFKGVFIPVLSALTFSADGSAQLSVSSMDFLPSIMPRICVELSPTPYSAIVDTCSSNTIVIGSDTRDLMTIKSFAKNYVNNLTKIEDSIQAVINDYFWEML
jgi:hypothetical protein